MPMWEAEVLQEVLHKTWHILNFFVALGYFVLWAEIIAAGTPHWHCALCDTETCGDCGTQMARL